MADDNKNPLDVLEELLNQSSAGAGAAKSGNAALSAELAAKAKEAEEKKLADELEAKRQELEQKQQDQIEADKLKLAEQIAAMAGIKDSDQYKARVQQDTDKKVADESKTSAGDGYEIDQLEHKKV